MRDVASLLAFLRLKQGQYPLISSLARRHGRRFAALAALPVAPAAPLPKKFFDTFWEPCIRAPASPSGGSHVQKHVLTEFYTPPPQRPTSVGFADTFPPGGKARVGKRSAGHCPSKIKKYSTEHRAAKTARRAEKRRKKFLPQKCRKKIPRPAEAEHGKKEGVSVNFVSESSRKRYSRNNFGGTGRAVSPARPSANSRFAF